MVTRSTARGHRHYPDDFSRIEGLLVASVKGEVRVGDKVHAEVDYFKWWANKIRHGEEVYLFRLVGKGKDRKAVPAGRAHVFRVKLPACHKAVDRMPDDAKTKVIMRVRSVPCE